MKQERFSRPEAQAKVGRAVQSLVEFSGIPKGTAGRVVEIDQIEPGGFEVVIEWQLPERRPLLCYWLTKKQYRRFLIEERKQGDPHAAV